MRFSLCVICGNEAEHILPMLDAFKPMFDELSLVRAIGARQPDNTEEMARKWCRANKKKFIFSEYRNGMSARDWDHVDSFGEARNAAFAQATGDWLFWADCDDIVEETQNFRSILEQAAPDVMLVRYFYDVRGTGKKLFRERAIRASAFKAGRKWHHDVHENLLIWPGDRHADLTDPVWVHAPKSIKRENRTRNLRILANSTKEAPTQYFYLHQEHYCSGNRDAALEFGKIATGFSNLPPAFRYEALINCARLTASVREAQTMLLEAHGVFPWCREALAGMVLLSFQTMKYDRAVWWANRMLETPEPLADKRPWTHEAKWYGWAGDDLAARAFRAEGNLGMATVCQARYYQGAKPKISLLHATRGRSSQAVGTRDMWLTSASNPGAIEHIFAVDRDDGTSVEMCRQFIHVVSDKQSCVAAWNLAAKKATGDILIQLSDDWVPFLGWDTKLMEAIGNRDPIKEQFVVAPHDGARTDDLLCMAILSRARLEAQGGEVFHEGYESVFSDNEFTHRAYRDGIVIDARKTLAFQHNHPAFGKGRMDSTYAHNNSEERYKSGKALFEARNP